MMGNLFYLIGKSCTGKDTLYRRLMQEEALRLRPVVMYTTRPIRSGEKDGREYHFTDEAGLRAIRESGRLIEIRSYHTCLGVWHYFTADDGQIHLEKNDYLMIGTLESYNKSRAYFGREHLVPLYVELEDGERLQRALDRERGQNQPNYEELCRRFLADSEDFSEEQIRAAGIERRFCNKDLEACLSELRSFILTFRQQAECRREAELRQQVECRREAELRQQTALRRDAEGEERRCGADGH